MFAKIKTLVTIIAILSITSFTKVFAADTPEKFNPTPVVMHHISDAHHFHIFGDVYLPLPCIAYSADGGFFFSLSSGFEYTHDAHISSNAIDGYVLYHDELMRLVDTTDNTAFPKGNQKLVPAGAGHHGHDDHGDHHDAEHEGDDHAHHAPTSFTHDGHTFILQPASKLQGVTSWYDFSITKNVFSMLLAMLLLFLVFGAVAKGYKKNKGKAPKGIQSLLEPIIVFMRDEVVKPAIGDKWEKFFPFILTLFFFILFCNLLGLIPFFPGSANITGNIGVTIVLAVFAFLVTNLNGNGHYWRHVFAMPGVPWPVLLILTPIEVLGLFIKPITLLIRLFANITAGHIMILSLISLIFVFSNLGENMGGAFGGGAIAVPFVFAMNFLELFVAFLQAFIFALLTSLYIGSAVEEHHHEEAH